MARARPASHLLLLADGQDSENAVAAALAHRTGRRARRAAGPGHYYDQIHRARPAADQYFGQQAGYMCYAR